jgi:hypothetical protein
MQKAEKRERKPRSDKGLIMATSRDLYCVAWIAEQNAARGDQVQRLLSRFPEKEKPFKDGKLIAETTLYDQLARWRKAGWVEYERVLADEPGYCWVTKKGLALVGLDDLYTAKAPATTRLSHIYAVNQLRLFLDQKYSWKSERRYRAEELAKVKGKKGRTSGPIPDGLITTKNGWVAIEAEISIKKAADLEAKMVRLVRHFASGAQGFESVFSAIWFYVASEKIKTAVEDAREALMEKEQGRVSVLVDKNILPSKFR